MWSNPAFWISILLLPLIYLTVGTVLGLFGSAVFSSEIQAAVVSAVVSGVLGSLTGFWLGSSFGSQKKTDASIEANKT
jgi:uncharacterized membrane protein YeaQ/YmgE (transglycosylase-associated protein family)